MATNNGALRDVLQFEAGLDYEVALKYGTGKAVSNGRVMFTTTQDEVFFLDPLDAEAIYSLELKPQEKFRMKKIGAGRNAQIEVRRINRTAERVSPCIVSGVQRDLGNAPPTTVEQPVVQTPAAPAKESAQSNVQNQSQPQNNSLSGIMASSYISAIDALMVARDYAEHKGIAFKISTGELRAAAHCIFIAASRQGVR